MQRYNTSQKQEILVKLKNSNKPLTIKELNTLLESSSKEVGLTTIYRYLGELEKEGKVKKYLRKTQEAEYLFLKNACREHMHLKCYACGMMTHISCAEMEEAKTHFQKKHRVVVDLLKSDFSGLCVKCNR